MRRLLGSLLALAVLSAGCTRDEPRRDEPAVKPVRGADPRCESPPRPAFYAENATYEDVDALDLPEAKPSEVDMDTGLLSDATEEIARSKRVLSFLVMRKGKLVWERYFNGSEAHHAENIHSAAKSLLSLVAGRAIDDGALDLDDTLAEHLPSQLLRAPVRDITVKDLLTMSGGLEWKENETENGFDASRSYVAQILSAERVDEPGKRFAYSTGLSEVLSAVIAEATGMSTCAFAHKELLSPIGVSVDHWPPDTAGYHAGGHSTFMTPRELVRVGRHVLDEGTDDAWLARTLAKAWDVGCRSPAERRSYGYLWWRSEIDGIDVYSAEGYGGQALMIVPSLDLAVVITHDTFTDPAGDVIPATEVLVNYVFPAAGVKVAPDADCHAFDVYRVDVDGSRPTRLTEHPSLDIWGSPSPDGKRIAFASRRDLNWELYVTDADGKNERRLTDDSATDGMPAWSPDGDRILFAKEGGPRPGLYTIAPDGTDAQRLTEGRDNTPAWSPDGKRIAFNRAEGESGSLWIRDMQSGDERRLEGAAGGVAPSFSYDGKLIAFYAADTVYTIAADGGQPEEVGPGRDPRWLPDGSLVYSARGTGTARIVRRAEGQTRTVVDLPGDELLPMPSMDGTWLTFVSGAADAEE